MLHQLAIEPRAQDHFFGLAQLVGRDQPGAKGAARIKVLARCHAVLLVVAHRAVHDDAVAADVGQGLRGRDVAPAFAHDDGDLAFEVEAIGQTRSDDGLPVTDQRLRMLAEHIGMGQVFLARLELMGLVGPAQGKHAHVPARVDRPIDQLVEPRIGWALGQRPRPCESVGLEQSDQIGAARAQACTEIDEAVVNDRTKRLFSTQLHAGQFHGEFLQIMCKHKIFWARLPALGPAVRTACRPERLSAVRVNASCRDGAAS